ncbi:MAG: hypothetical protein R3278_01270 [Lysobacter spongiicola]|nr:hypothetical protein [Lysobacter spongiicola]
MPRHVRKPARPPQRSASPKAGKLGPRGEQRRLRIAQEAARLMAEGGFRDYHQAKVKAAQRLGVRDLALLPQNIEVEQALREHQRLFQPDAANELGIRREAALAAMEFFQPFNPRLVGAVLEGTADAHSVVALHLHSDDPDAVARHLEQHGIPAAAGARRLRLDAQRSSEFPTWSLVADDLPFELTVLPTAQLRQAPLSTIDERPMRRASTSRLKELLCAGPPDADPAEKD